ncbi:MAG: V4R domain-containing protein, partial [Desulfobacteraceae bacterium]
ALYKGGFEGGFLSSKKYREIYGLSDLEIIEFMTEMGGQIGWGKFHLDNYDKEARVLEISVEDSPFAEAREDARRPVCDLIRGVVAGMGSALLEMEVGAEERSCKALGDDCCRFVLV